jgi:hypothetical protein
MTKTFFLSHSTKDKNLVSEFMNLMRLGMNLGEQDIFCTSQDGIRVGDSYIDVIRNNLNDAKIIIMLISKNYMESPFCLCEMGAAWASEKIKIPILVNVGFDAIEYPATPLKTTQVSLLKNTENLHSIYDVFKDRGYINAKTISFTNQLKVFMSNRVWENPEENNLDIEVVKEEVGSVIKEINLRDEAISRLKPISDYDLHRFEPTSENLLSKQRNRRSPERMIVKKQTDV